MTLFLFSILGFLSTERQSVALWEFSHTSKIAFLGNLLSRFFEDRGPTSSIYVSTLKDLALLVCCQSNIILRIVWASVSSFDDWTWKIMLSFAVSNTCTNPDLLLWCFLKICGKDGTCWRIPSSIVLFCHGSPFLFPGRILHISWLIHWYALT